MIPVWIIGSNIDTSSPLLTPSEKLERDMEEEKKRREDRELNKKNSETFEKISFNIRGLVRGFTSLFQGGGTSSSITNTGSTSSGLSGNSNEAKVWNFFKEKGLSDEAVAGIMGNISQESRFDPTASEKEGKGRDDAGGYGLIQWTGGRRQKLFDTASAQGKDVNDLEFQLNYLWDEAFSDGYYKNALDNKGFFNSNSVADTTQIFHNVVEGSADTQSMIQKNRIEPAQKYYNQYKGTSNSSSSSTVTNTNSSNNNSTLKLSTGNTTSSTGSSAIDKAVAWAVKIANDNSHGYDQGNRQGPDYDCSSLIINAYEQAGIPVKTNGASYTGNMESVFKKLGFIDVTTQTNHGKNISALQKGDVLLRPASHVEMYIGDGKKVGAHSNERGGITGGQTGDQTGHEIDVGPMSGTWDIVLRAPGTFTAGSVVDSENNATSSILSGGLGAFDSEYAITDDEKAQVEAQKYWKALRESGGHAYNSIHNDTKQGENKAEVIKENTSGWKSSYSNDTSSLVNFANSKAGFDSSKSNNGKSPYEIINNNNDSSSIIYNPSNTSPSGGDGIGNGGNNGGSVINPPKPDDISDERKKYYEKLIELLTLIEKNTSNIPITNKLLNEIIKLLDEGCCCDNNDNEEIKENNSNIIESLFGPIDSDINLIATGI